MDLGCEGGRMGYGEGEKTEARQMSRAPGFLFGVALLADFSAHASARLRAHVRDQSRLLQVVRLP
jgi:hypothetical protein